MAGFILGQELAKVIPGVWLIESLELRGCRLFGVATIRAWMIRAGLLIRNGKAFTRKVQHYRGYIGVIQGIYWGYIGRMEKNTETTTLHRVIEA